LSFISCWVGRPSAEVTDGPTPSVSSLTQTGGIVLMSSDVTTTHAKQLDREQLLALYRQMVLIRRCEEQLARAHQRGLIHGACHTYVGQEANEDHLPVQGEELFPVELL